MKLSAIAKRVILVIGLLALVIITASVIYYRSPDFIPFALGVLLGSALNVLKVIMLERTVNKSVGMDPANASNYIRIQHFLRFLLTGAVLILAVFVPFISLWGTAAGIVSLQIAVMTSRYYAPKD